MKDFNQFLVTLDQDKIIALVNQKIADSKNPTDMIATASTNFTV
ncbi:hypothetical protein [Anaerotignum sp.]|nr:hypothetical protein [Anaerotignum sp.]